MPFQGVHGCFFSPASGGGAVLNFDGINGINGVGGRGTTFYLAPAAMIIRTTTMAARIALAKQSARSMRMRLGERPWLLHQLK